MFEMFEFFIEAELAGDYAYKFIECADKERLLRICIDNNSIQCLKMLDNYMAMKNAIGEEKADHIPPAMFYELLIRAMLIKSTDCLNWLFNKMKEDGNINQLGKCSERVDWL